MRQRVAQGAASIAFVPAGIGLPYSGCGSHVWRKTQEHEGRRSPVRPMSFLVRGPDEAPHPAHRLRGAGAALIARTRDNRKRHQSRDFPPVAPTGQLNQIVTPHDPYAPQLLVAEDSPLHFIYVVSWG